MQCRALQDGLMGTAYIHAGEVFEADKCPSWAEAVKTTPAKTRPAAKTAAGSEQGE